MSNSPSSHSTITGTARESLREQIVAQGVTLCGFSRPRVDAEAAEHLKQWLAEGRHADMTWMARNPAQRADPTERFAWARTAVCVALAYDRPEPRQAGVLPRISRYAQGRNYHNVLRKRLRRIGDVVAAAGGTRWRAYCDTGPVMERQLAAAAGVGWLGKHTLLLHPQWGSYLFLAVGFTDLEIAPDGPITDHCGSCTACVDVCPTGALDTPHVLDANRCISYLNIEHRADWTPPQDAPLAGWLHGCDLCQEACPFVGAARRRERWGDAEFRPREVWRESSLAEIARWTEAQWDTATRGSAVRRGGPERLQRVARRLASEEGDAMDEPPVKS